MDVSKLFSQAWRLTWNNKYLWLLGFISGLTGLAFSLLIRTSGRWILDSTTNTGILDISAAFSEQSSWLLLLIGGIIAVFLLAILLWLLAVIAEGGVIQSVDWLLDAQSISFRRAWKAGMGYLGRLITIDTVIFFPVFFISLFGLLLASGALFGVIIYGSSGGGNLSGVFKFIGAASGGVLALLCLVIPITIATFLFRILAFRSAIIEGKGVRQSIGRSWEIARNFPANILALVLFLWVIRYLLGLPSSLIDMSLVTLSLGGSLTVDLDMTWLSTMESLLFILGILVRVLTILVGAVLNTFIIVTWTLAYRDWAENLTRGGVERLSGKITAESS